MHHRAVLAPFLLLGTLDAIKLLNKIKSLNQKLSLQTVSISLVLITLGLQYFFHFPLNKLSKKIYWQEESWMEDNKKLISLVPTEASIATQQNLVPHLSHRQEIYLAWPRKHDNNWWLDFGGKPEYLVVDLRPNQWLTQTLESNENFQSAVKNMERAGKIILEKEVNDAKLYRIID